MSQWAIPSNNDYVTFVFCFVFLWSTRFPLHAVRIYAEHSCLIPLARSQDRKE